MSFARADCWVAWWSQVQYQLYQSDWSNNVGNYALSRTVLEHTGWHIGTPVAAAIALGAAGALVLRRRACVREAARAPAPWRDDVLMAGLGAVIVTTSPRLAWTHYFCLLIPLGLFLLGGDAGRSSIGKIQRVLAMLAAIGIAAKNIMFVLGTSVVSSPAFFAWQVGIATVLLAGAAILQLSDGRLEPRADEGPG
jgi:hypothetical protein